MALNIKVIVGLLATGRITTPVFAFNIASPFSQVRPSPQYQLGSTKTVSTFVSRGFGYCRPSLSLMMAPKEGVSTSSELRSFVESAGDKLLVVDVRNPDANVEPGDAKSLIVAGLPKGDYRPSAVSLVWDRNTASMPLPDDSIAKDAPIITHCGGGGRGQKAKEFLEANGFTNVLNGGGPKETECW
eukprot:CAMPEP_0113305366 /NCGR_PEP_ID=MMETSP0010_2-20120614/5020_1 /TAXON_ID=216773 ORGANISM="Corethron hystrix, Strain 308" /NCGR_SAMPLE_ID=MMETSP0010_2 /ASSEMBLY_ACC=CAM_ASM_000155 /LENGTH=185 /DNA_ID=CAMNT_0000159767 /DNA_START=25 /DNA_END=579 /DNA_ORIENTATION=- /assembly_acc=CAM_ASM_000155